MKWTTDRPTVAGWYWMRRDGRDQIALVDMLSSFDKMDVIQPGLIISPISDFTHFAGPIPTPNDDSVIDMCEATRNVERALLVLGDRVVEAFTNGADMDPAACGKLILALKRMRTPGFMGLVPVHVAAFIVEAVELVGTPLIGDKR